uniref:Uncharacterized protein n=1 Tax=Aegilops tauschii TaxID=37682 RepID=M8AKX6_AEGTA
MAAAATAAAAADREGGLWGLDRGRSVWGSKPRQHRQGDQRDPGRIASSTVRSVGSRVGDGELGGGVWWMHCGYRRKLAAHADGSPVGDDGKGLPG